MKRFLILAAVLAAASCTKTGDSRTSTLALPSVPASQAAAETPQVVSDTMLTDMAPVIIRLPKNDIVTTGRQGVPLLTDHIEEEERKFASGSERYNLVRLISVNTDRNSQQITVERAAIAEDPRTGKQLTSKSYTRYFFKFEVKESKNATELHIIPARRVEVIGGDDTKSFHKPLTRADYVWYHLMSAAPIWLTPEFTVPYGPEAAYSSLVRAFGAPLREEKEPGGRIKGTFQLPVEVRGAKDRGSDLIVEVHPYRSGALIKTQRPYRPWARPVIDVQDDLHRLRSAIEKALRT